jgi:leader peptidase (prepilin peptidase) / N-methyltransferase
VNNFLETLSEPCLGIVFVAILGLIWGSFFNVCILRVPDNLSLIPRSHCTKCQAPIPWFLNVPVFSYLYLRGRCHACREKISIQYPLVELGTALLYVALYLHFGLGIHLLAYAVLVSLLVVISVIDLHHQIIPDELSLPGCLLGLGAVFLTKDITWIDSLLGIGLGGGLFLGIAYLYERFTKREGLGGGDIKLLAMIGAWLGYKSILVVIIFSSALGSLVGIGLMLAKRKNLKTAIPFGPFLALAALIYLFWGAQIQSVLFPEF